MLTAEQQPPMDRLPAVRLALTRASRARTMFLEKTYPALIAHAPAKQQAALRTLWAEGKINLVSSGQHIGKWSLCEITGRWPEYCAASKAMRAQMRARVRQEAELIYPLLAEPSLQMRVA